MEKYKPKFRFLLPLIGFLCLCSSDLWAGFDRSSGAINIPTASSYLQNGDFEQGISASISSTASAFNARLNYAITDKSEIGISILNESTSKLNFQWQIYGFEKIRLALGMQNIPMGGTSITNEYSFSPFVVASLFIPQTDLFIHIGKGWGRFLQSGSSQLGFSGIFFGVEKKIHALNLLADFDGNYLNVGVRYFLTPNIIINGAAIQLNDATNGFAACIGLSYIQPSAKKIDESAINKIIESLQLKSETQALILRSTQNNEMGQSSDTTQTGITGIETRKTLDNLALEHAQTGARFYYQGNYKEAVESFSKAISLNPSVALFHSQLGSVYYKLKMYESALSEWKKALELNPADKQLSSFIENFEKQIH